MKKDVVLYRERGVGLRLFFLIPAVISIFVVFLDILVSLYNQKTVELEAYIFPVIVFIIGICIYFFMGKMFTGHTSDIIISYNEKGFYKHDIGFIEWNNLKSWTLKKKKKSWKYGDYMFNTIGKPTYYIFIEQLLGTWGHDIIYTLTLVLGDDRKIVFVHDEVVYIKKFIKYLRHNYKEKMRASAR